MAFKESFINSLGSGLAGGLFDLVGMFQQNSNIDKAFEQQKELADLAFRNNMAMAYRQNQWAQEAVERANDYNDFGSVMNRAERAGVNPNFALGAGTPSEVARTADAPQYYAPDASILGQKKTIGQVLQSGLSAAMQQKQLELMETQKEKTGAETDNIRTATEWMDTLNSKKVELDNSNIALNDSLRLESKQRAAKIGKEMEGMDLQFELFRQDIEKVKVEIESMQQDVALKKIDRYFKSTEWKYRLGELHARIKNLNVQSHVSLEQLQLNTTELASKLITAASEQELNGYMAEYYNQLGINARVEEDKIQFNLSQDKEWDDIERTVGCIQQFLVGIGAGVGAALGLQKVSKGGDAKL